MPMLPASLLQQRRVLAMQPWMGEPRRPRKRSESYFLFSACNRLTGCKRTVVPNIVLAEIRLIAEKNLVLEQSSRHATWSHRTHGWSLCLTV